MRIESLFDLGSARVSEDARLIRPPFFVVSDGVSPPYSYNRSHAPAALPPTGLIPHGGFFIHS